MYAVHRVEATWMAKMTATILETIAGPSDSAIIVHRSHGRKLVNEAALVRAFAELSPPVRADVVDFAKLSVREQVQRVASARYLVGMQGAGMANAVFLRERASIILLKPHQYYGKYLDGLMVTLGLRFECWQPPSGELRWAVMDRKKCKPNWEYTTRPKLMPTGAVALPTRAVLRLTFA
jgi:capsular polysaccharide biosynthesis protein